MVRVFAVWLIEETMSSSFRFIPSAIDHFEFILLSRITESLVVRPNQQVANKYSI
jgi:hypothetical protein